MNTKLAELPARWRRAADEYRNSGRYHAAASMRECADELQRVLDADGRAVLGMDNHHDWCRNCRTSVEQKGTGEWCHLDEIYDTHEVHLG